MPKQTIILLFLSLAIACRTTTITQSSLHPPHAVPYQIDTVICLKISDHRKLPDPGFLISTIHLSLPEARWPHNYDSLLNFIKQLARQQGGNVIKVSHEMYSVFLSRLSMDVQVFSLEDPFLSTYKASIDSAADAYKDSIKNISIVRLINYDDHRE